MIIMLMAVTLLMVLLLGLGIFVVARRVRLCAPDTLLVVSGRADRSRPGNGYTLVHGGRVLPLPLLEAVDALRLAPISLSLPLHQVTCKDGQPVRCTVHATVRVAGEADLAHQAARLLLGLPEEQLRRMASRMLHGAALLVLPSLELRQVHEDQLLVCEHVQSELEHPLSRLGLVCDDLRLEF